MTKIKNIRTHASDKQRRDYITSLKSKKRMYLQNTDWTQLEDVKVLNQDDVDKWRQKLRDFQIDNESGEETEKQLDQLIAQQPVIQHESNTKENLFDTTEISDLKKKLQKLEKDNRLLKESLNDSFKESHEFFEDIYGKIGSKEKSEPELIYLDYNEAIEKIKELFIEYKNKTLMDNSILEYNLKRTMLEEAIDIKFSDSDSGDASLISDGEDLESVIDQCRDYFKTINSVYLRLKKEETSIYNMSVDELDQWFNKNGYRYRCKN